MIILTSSKRIKNDRELIKRLEQALSEHERLMKDQILLVETQSRLIAMLEMENSLLKSKG